MNRTDDLIRLVRALGKNEKRYIRILLEKGMGKEATSCVKLFDAIARLTTDDDDALRRAVRNESFAGHLHVTKNHLYNLIQRGLRAYHAGRTPQSKARELIESAYIMLEKGLLEQSSTLFEKAWGIAERYELFPEQLRLLELQRSLEFWLWRHIDPDKPNNMRARYDEIIDRMTNRWAYRDLLSQMEHQLFVAGKPRTAGEREEYEALIRHPLLSDRSQARTLVAEWNYFDIYRLYYLALRDYQQGYEHSLRQIAFVDSYPLPGGFNVVDHAVTLYNHILICVRLKKLEEAERTVEKIAKLSAPSPIIKGKLEGIRNNSRLSLLFARQDFAEIVAMEKEMEAHIERYGTTSARQLRIKYPFSLSYANFMLGNYRKALAKLRPLLDMKEEMRYDVHTSARLLHMMIHFEQRNLELLPYLWRSTYRYLLKRSSPHRYEKIILDFLRRLPGIYHDRDLKREFRRLHDEIDALEHDPYEYEPAVLFNIRPWLKEKLKERKPVYADVKQRRAA